MINIRSIYKLKDNEGLTLKKGKKVVYKTGWQVATVGFEAKTARECINIVKRLSGNCGVWYSNGIYYIDKSGNLYSNYLFRSHSASNSYCYGLRPVLQVSK